MANVATALPTVPMAMSSGRQGFSQVTPVVVTMDTVASDLTVYTPSISTNYAAIIGISYNNALAHTLTIKSNTTTLVTYSLTTFQGLSEPFGTGGFIAIGKKGEALKINAGTNPILSALLYVVEFPSLNFNTR